MRIEPELLAAASETVRQLGIAGLICIGGDGSLAIAQQLHEHGIPVVGVPKTIDHGARGDGLPRRLELVTGAGSPTASP